MEHSARWLSIYSYPSYLLILSVLLLIIRRQTGFRIYDFFILSSLIISTLGSALIQGRTYCIYHYVPVQWSIALMAGVVLSKAFPFKSHLNYIFLILLLVKFLLFASDLYYVIPPPLFGTRFAQAIKSKLSKNDLIVTYGFFPSFLSELERKTPFPHIDSESAYQCVKSGSEHKIKVLNDLHKALENNKVKYFIILKGKEGQIYEGGIDRLLLFILGYRETKPDILWADAYYFYERKYIQ